MNLVVSRMLDSCGESSGTTKLHPPPWRRPNTLVGLVTLSSVLYSRYIQALCEWDRSIYSFKLPTPSMKIVFHQYDPHLAMCDEGSTIR